MSDSLQGSAATYLRWGENFNKKYSAIPSWI